MHPHRLVTCILRQTVTHPGSSPRFPFSPTFAKDSTAFYYHSVIWVRCKSPHNVNIIIFFNDFFFLYKHAMHAWMSAFYKCKFFRHRKKERKKENVLNVGKFIRIRFQTHWYIITVGTSSFWQVVRVQTDLTRPCWGLGNVWRAGDVETTGRWCDKRFATSSTEDDINIRHSSHRDPHSSTFQQRMQGGARKTSGCFIENH